MPSEPTQLWALRAPSGEIVPETVTVNRDDAWLRGYAWLDANSEPGWMQRYWKRWDASKRAARRRGWRIVKVRAVPQEEGTRNAE